MDTVNNYLNKIQKYVGELDEFMAGGVRSKLRRGGVTVDEETFYKITQDIRDTLDDMARDLPSEINEARRIIKEADKLIDDGRRRAGDITRDASEDAKIRVSEHEIMRVAQEEYDRITIEAKKYARDMRIAANNYYQGAVDLLEEVVGGAIDSFNQKAADAKKAMEASLDDVREMRSELDEYVKEQNEKYAAGKV